MALKMILIHQGTQHTAKTVKMGGGSAQGILDPVTPGVNHILVGCEA